jgi:cytosine/adenosine deaminase-related metal-dependent hydrolase
MAEKPHAAQRQASTEAALGSCNCALSDRFFAAILVAAMIYRARTLVTMDGPPIDDGAVAIEGAWIGDAGRFDEVRARNGGEVADLGEVVLLPGLINAHSHLDYTLLRGTIAPQRSFADWIRQINGMRREFSEDDFLDSISLGFAEARRWGTTTIANIESMPQLLARMPSPPLRTWWFLELIDVRSRLVPEELVAAAISLGERKHDWPGGFGLSPHAPYTASAELSRAAADVAARNKMLLTMHLAESAEEMEMFRDGRGPLFELLQNLGRPMEDCSIGQTPLATMLNRQTIDERWIVVHLNELAEEDLARLERGPRFHIAHCPRSSRYFQHTPFAMRRLRALGFNICLGTDSLASNSSLSLFSEMRAVRDAHPWLTAHEILEMATVNGARALDQVNTLGKIRAGFNADLIAVPIEGKGMDPFEEITAWSEPVGWMLVAGVPARLSS